MKTKIKRHSRSVLSVVLSLCILVSCMTVGIIATDAAKVTGNSEAVGATADSESVGTAPAAGSTVIVKMGIYAGQSGNYFAYLFDDSQNINEWVPMTEITSGYYNGYYYFNVPSTTYAKIAICRKDTSDSTGSWSNVWNQTQDLEFNGNYFQVGGSWKGYSTNPDKETLTSTTRAFQIYNTVSGTSQALTDTGNGVYTYSGQVTANSTTTGFKFNDGSNWYGHSGSNYTFTTVSGTLYNISATLDIKNVYKGDNNDWTGSTFVLTEATTTLTTPTISFNNSGAVNNGDGALLTVTNHSSYPAAANVSYELYKNSTKLTSGYSYNNGVFTIPSTTYSDGDSYQVKAIAGNTTDYANSSLSSAATLTVYEPKYALLGCADSADIENIINSQASHASTKAYGWPSTPVDDATHFNSTVVVDGPTEDPGVYKITFTTKNPTEWDINIGLYQKTVGQRGFSYNGTEYTDPARGKELKVPSAGLSGVQIIDGTSSMQFKPNITYTITIDQRGANDILSITSDAADIWAIARVKTFNPTTGQLNTSVANATAVIGTATASPSAGKVPFTSTLTAEVADSTKYDFAGWYTDANCTTSYNANTTTTATVSTDITYYALFTQKTPDTVNLTIATTGSGTVTPTSGTHSGSGSSYTIYPGATVVFTATPGTDYELDTVTSTSGTVTKSGNTVTVSNITQAATVTFNFIEVVSYNVSVAADSATYGTFTVNYTNKQGQSIDIASTSTTQNIVVKHDTIVTVTATANTSGSVGVFNGWSMSTTNYQRSKETPLSANTLRFIPTGAVIATANFSQNPITGDQITSNYYIKVANNKTDTYSTNVPLYRTVVNSNNEFRSYFEIGDTDDPANGKLKVGTNYWFIISSKSGDASISDSHYDQSPSITKSPIGCDVIGV